MTEIACQCPHCGTEKVGFEIFWEQVYNSREWIPGRRLRGGTAFYQIAAQCKICRKIVGMLLEYEGSRTSPREGQGDPQGRGYAISEVWPSSDNSSEPDHLPERVKRAYLQGEDNFRRSHWETAGMSFRRALEMTTKEKLPHHKGTLRDRIDELAKGYAITKELKEFAHHIRLDGNEAAHDADVTEKEASEMLDFTRLFLMYMYSLPGMLAARNATKVGTTN